MKENFDLMNNIPISLLLEFVLIIVILLGCTFIYTRLIIPSSHNKNTKALLIHWGFRIQLVFWAIFVLYFVYQLFQHSPGFTILLLVLIFAPFWRQWKDLLSGIFLKWENKLSIGDQVDFEGQQGKLLKIGILNIMMESQRGTVLTIPNSVFSTNGFSQILATDEETLVEIKLAKSTVSKLGGLSNVKKIVIASPWSNPSRHPELIALDNDEILLKTWALSPEDRTNYQEFLRSKLA